MDNICKLCGGAHATGVCTSEEFAIQKEIIEKRENLPEAVGKMLDDFMEFAKNRELFESEKQEKLWDAYDVIYEYFYRTEQSEKPSEFFGTDQEALDQVSEQLSDLVEDLKERQLADVLEERKEFVPKGWLFYRIAEGVKREDEARIYINTKMEERADFFAALIEELTDLSFDLTVKAGEAVGFSAKMALGLPNRQNSGSIPEKIVIYFDSKSQKGLLDLLEDLSDEFSDTLITGEGPQFTAQILDSSGKKMPGVTFGESHPKEESFGMARSKILGEVYDGLSAEDLQDKEKVALAYIEACKKYKVDPRHPAFNDAQKTQFDLIKQRILE